MPSDGWIVTRRTAWLLIQQNCISRQILPTSLCRMFAVATGLNQRNSLRHKGVIAAKNDFSSFHSLCNQFTEYFSDFIRFGFKFEFHLIFLFLQNNPSFPSKIRGSIFYYVWQTDDLWPHLILFGNSSFAKTRTKTTVLFRIVLNHPE